MKKILIVEDEIALRETLAYNFRKDGYTVDVVSDGESALKAARENEPDLIILDIMLPVMDGFEVCRILRNESNVPIIMLTAKAEEIDRIIGLEIGADDYITKPFSTRELLARVKAQLRRVRLLHEEFGQRALMDTGKITIGNMVLNLNRSEVVINDQSMQLKPKEYNLLLYLVRRQGQVLSRNQILKDVWGWDYQGVSRTVDVHIRWLREKIEDDPNAPKRIVTIRGIGYRFEG
jgi:DNA-binding response OmpR family regulator